MKINFESFVLFVELWKKQICETEQKWRKMSYLNEKKKTSQL